MNFFSGKSWQESLATECKSIVDKFKKEASAGKKSHKHRDLETSQYDADEETRIAEDIDRKLEKMSSKQLKIVLEAVKVIEKATSDIARLERPVRYRKGDEPISSNSRARKLRRDSYEEPELDLAELKRIERERACRAEEYDAKMREVNSDIHAYHSKPISAIDYGNKTKTETDHFTQQIHAEIEHNRKIDSDFRRKLSNERRKQIEEHHHYLESLEKTSRENKLQRKTQWDEYNKKSDFEFQQKLDKKEQDQKEALRKIREQRGQYEEETRRLHEEAREELRRSTEAFVQCSLLKQRFEMEEEKWSRWLGTIKSSIGRAKNQFDRFENEYGIHSFSVERTHVEQEMMQEELLSLHQSTLAAYDMVYEAWEKMMNLSETYKEQIFIRIVQSSLVPVCNKLYIALDSLDHYMKHGGSMDTLSGSFADVNSFSIITTQKLRDLSRSAKPEDYQFIEAPLVYRNHSVAIEEVQDDYGTPVYKKTTTF